MRPQEKVTKQIEAFSVPTPWLRDCLVDGDESARRTARGSRRRALAASIAVQLVLLASVVIVPLFAHIADPGYKQKAPLPPYVRIVGEPPQSSAQHSGIRQPNRG